ncbi:alpha- and gamma-adaptin-binding protein p34-like [Agrilus planipennis]|uniref:Alpha- and gamma-adaptin-binding protein p34-like n=1 Tax=Agrilus planipennis TaxID=224129 RepID=A0A1W4WNK8_AGRPL|nr:alpha- and gamma-adaptin-binding protein p34-like [Agrilus planipennis]XP_025836856.1 alpha- and gamma-adaptin-binding protein p34-like [Agrilus planipennis]
MDCRPVGKTAAVDESVPDRIHCIWHVDTKYYTADINIFGITEKFLRTDEFNNTIHAVIVHMDSNKECGLEDLKKLEDLFNECNPEVKLLVCNYITEESQVPKTKALGWCLKNSFELIELYPNNSECTDLGGDIFKEKVGVDRIIESLQTYVWPNLIMKSEKLQGSCNIANVTKQEDSPSVCNIIGPDDMDDFSELFSHLQMMKESIKGMPMNQRKQCAEQMVTAFWKAIGGEDDELEELDQVIS